MRLFFNAIFVQLVLNAYVLWWFWRVRPKYKAIKITVSVIFAAELVVYMVGFIFSGFLPLSLLHYVAWIGTSWMVFILYLSGLLIVYDAVRLFNHRRKRILPASVNMYNPKLVTAYFYICLLAVVLAMGYGNYRFRHPAVTHLSVNVDKEAPGIDRLRIVMVADVHTGALIGKDMLQKYVDMIMEQEPDMILMVGDLIDYDLASVKEQRLDEEFRQLKAPLGVYASTGNHEYIEIEGEAEDEKIMWLSEAAGLTVLRDSVVMVADAFYLIGREDDKKEDRKPLDVLMAEVDKNYPVIVMNHEPRRLREESQAGADIALYGHTHNGQLFPYNLVLKLAYEVAYGYKKKDNTHIYVTSGLGLAGPQYRIGTQSELVVLDVNFKKD